MADVVKFLLPNGTEVSNDPRFYQEDMRKQLEAQAKALLEQREPAAEADEDEEEQEPSKYDAQTGKELKAEAEKRGLELKGITKKSQLVALLESDDAAQADEDVEEDAEEDGDEGDEPEGTEE
jgi:hypothetical protein